MNKKELIKILKDHKKWLYGNGEKRADLCDADLHGADLHGADLREANLCGADLHGADLHYADLHGADLRGADLHGADLCDADLRGAYLHYADLHGADLCDADLCDAELDYADLREADLCGASLDYSCIPIWYGSLKAHFDDKQIIQIVYHAVKAGLCSKNTSDEVKNELRKLISLANRFHMVNTCGKIEEG